VIVPEQPVLARKAFALRFCDIRLGANPNGWKPISSGQTEIELPVMGPPQINNRDRIGKNAL
jgi:hypothetical protein